MQQCHLCYFAHCQPSGLSSQTSLSPPQQCGSTQALPKCCIKRCNKKYCIGCIRQKFDAAFQESNYRADTWICYSCQNLCTCTICKGIVTDKKGSKRKNNIGSGPGKQESKPDPDKDPELEDYYSKEQIDAAAPFHRRVLQRRNHLYKLMAATTISSSQQPTQPASKSQKEMPQTLNKQEGYIKLQQKSIAIKQLISKTLKDYGDDDSNDIQLLD